MVRTLRLCRFCCCLVGFGMCVVTNQTILFSVYNFVFLSLNHVVHAGNPSEHLTPKRKRQCNCKNSKSVPPLFFCSFQFLPLQSQLPPCYAYDHSVFPQVSETILRVFCLVVVLRPANMPLLGAATTQSTQKFASVR